MRTRTTVAAVLLLAATATACSSSGEPEKIRVTVTQTVTATPGEEADAEPSSSSDTYAFGDLWEFEGTDDGDAVEGSVTVLGYKQGGIKTVGSASEEAGAPGYVWAYTDLKVCSTKGSYTDDTTSWTLYYSDGSRVDPSSSTYGDFPKPEFPTQVTVTAGKCVRGKLVFPVPGGKRPESVLYAPPGTDEPVEWKVSK
jgi:hypothetical protein